MDFSLYPSSFQINRCLFLFSDLPVSSILLAGNLFYKDLILSLPFIRISAEAGIEQGLHD
jgi:hypothetical protein